MNGLAKFGFFVVTVTFLLITAVRILFEFNIGVPAILADIGTVSAVFLAFAAVMIVGSKFPNIIVLLITFVAVLVLAIYIVYPLYDIRAFQLVPTVVM